MGVKLNWLSSLVPYTRLRIDTDLPADELYQRLADETLSAVQRRHPIHPSRKNPRKKTPFYDYPFIRVFFAYREYDIAVDRNADSFSVTDHNAYPLSQQIASVGQILPNAHGYTIELEVHAPYISLVFILVLILVSMLSIPFPFLSSGLYIPWYLLRKGGSGRN